MSEYVLELLDIGYKSYLSEDKQHLDVHLTERRKKLKLNADEITGIGLSGMCFYIYKKAKISRVIQIWHELVDEISIDDGYMEYHRYAALHRQKFATIINASNWAKFQKWITDHKIEMSYIEESDV